MSLSSGCFLTRSSCDGEEFPGGSVPFMASVEARFDGGGGEGFLLDGITGTNMPAVVSCSEVKTTCEGKRVGVGVTVRNIKIGNGTIYFHTHYINVNLLI